MRAAVALADELIGQPGRWQAREALGRVSHLLGEDDAAAVAYAEAGDLIESFAVALAPPRSARFLAAPVISQILSLAGGTPAARRPGC